MRKKKKTSQNRPIETLRIEAAKFLAAGHYKEAIETYKRLLKKEQREEWQTALAKAYLLRAQALADKGMYKEAAVLWENRANLCPDKKCIEQYLSWLIRAGRYVRAARLSAESTTHLSEAATRELHAQFGAILLAGYTDLMVAFPEESALIKQYALIKKALQAYTQGDNDSTEKYLKQIPFRSPYRDFRSIIKALLIIDNDPNGANQLLEKIPADSPYVHFAQLIRMLGWDGEFLLEGLSQLAHHQRRFIANLKGWDKDQLKVISMLQSAVKRDSSPKGLLEVVATNQQSLGEHYSRQFCSALLPSYSAGMKYYENLFGSLSTFEKNRILALSRERQGHSLRADKYWQVCIDDLKRSENQENTLKAALILRHIVENAEKRGDENGIEVPENLEESLRLDPDDKATYLGLVQWYKRQNDKRTYQKWVDSAIKHFPKDSEVLLVAMEAATSKNAFKKAVGFAKTLLQVDPINVKARQVARFSHISHARKLIKLGKYELARKELKQAARFEKTSQRSGVVQINQGLLELQAEGFVKPKRGGKKNVEQDSPQALKNPQIIDLLEEGVQLAGGGIRGHFRLIVESMSQNLEPTHIRPLVFQLDRRYSPNQHEILELINFINAYSEQGITFLAKALDLLKGLFKKVTKLDFSQAEMLSLCQCLKKVEHYGLLKQFADIALKHWADFPPFVYYQIYGKAKGKVHQISMIDFERLQEAVDEAERQNDKRTSVMIMGLLNQIGGPPSFIFDNFEDDLEALENLDDMNPEELIKILKRLKDIGIEIPGLDIPHLPPKRKR